MDLVDRSVTEEDERRLKNLATRIMSNGVEVLVKDKSQDGKLDQRKLKFMHITSMKPPHHHVSSSPPKQSLLSSAVATFVNHQHMSALFPIRQLMQHNYIIKTCMTTYTYLTTVVHNKRSAISTFETIVSVVTTESLTNLYATDVMADIKPTKTKYMEVKTIHPLTPSNTFISNLPKIDKRIDNEDEDNDSFDLIQPSEPGHVPCTTSCSCSHTKTEGLKTKYTNVHNHPMSGQTQYGVKTSKYGTTKIDLRPTKVESIDKKTQYGPYEYDVQAPTDRIVEKYTEVVNDYSDEKDSNSVEESELLTNEQAPAPPKSNKVSHTKVPEKPKPEKPQKPNKNKVLVADLLKLGSLGIKGLSQLAPVFEKMTGGFIKRQEPNKTTTTTTVKPITKITPYHVNKRLDSDIESKQSNFPIYIPVDLETSESQLVFTNATLHQNLAWAAEHKQPKSHIVPPRMIHESPLVNGGIPISPGEIITANSDVIVGKPAVGGPLTLAASGIKLHNPVNPPPIDSFVAANEEYLVKEQPSQNEHSLSGNVDDSYDLRPPGLPKPKPNRNVPRPSIPPYNHQASQHSNSLNKQHSRLPPLQSSPDHMMKTEHLKSTNTFLGNHGRPAFLDYIPSLAKPNGTPYQQHNDFKPVNEGNMEGEIADNSPSSSEIVNTRVTTDGEYASSNAEQINKPFLVDIQPSRVANVLIPHGSATALVFAGSSEPHKTGDYIDDPLPYPEPGYFGSFSIDAPQMTNVHNVAPNNKPFNKLNVHHSPENYKPNLSPPFKDQPYRNDLKLKWKDNKRPTDFNKIPPPTSNLESHAQVGPQITAYNPDIYHPSNGDLEKYKQIRGNKYKDGKGVIDKEYENYLAVPPPPPKMHFNQESNYDSKNRPYNQRPIVHTKPVQDMKVFLNIQHPVPKTPNPESLPPKVTSEIYYAAQSPHSSPTPTYTVHIPSTSNYNNHHNKPQTSTHQIPSNNNFGHTSNSFSVVSSPNFSNKSIFTNDIIEKDNTYSVTLNTAANVASHVGETGQVVGSSIPVAIGTSSNNGQLNADIPIGTNFAIRVEDGSSHDSYNLQNNRNPPIIYNGKVPEVTIGDNRWNQSTSANQGFVLETTVIGQNYHNQNFNDKSQETNHHQINNNNGQNYYSQNFDEKQKETGSKLETISDRPNYYNQNFYDKPKDKESKPETIGAGQNYYNNKFYENQKNTRYEVETPTTISSASQNYYNQNVNEKPDNTKHKVENILTGQNHYNQNTNKPKETVSSSTSPSQNSHANFPMIHEPTTLSNNYNDVKPVTEYVDDIKSDQKRPSKHIPNIPTNSHGWYSSLLNENNINSIKVEATTRKIIPLLHEYNKDSVPNFGQKITSAGKPPTEYWSQNKNPPAVHNNFNIGKPFTKPQAVEKPSSTSPPNNYNPEYIPSYFGGMKQPAYDIPIRDNSDETTTTKISIEKVKPVYENSEEIYDGEEENYSNGESDGEISSESMKIPVVTSSHEVLNTTTSIFKGSTDITLLQDEVFESSKDTQKEKNVQFVEFNPGTQTEKPFITQNKTTFTSNTIKPIYNQMKPRPFTANTAIPLDHQLHQPHWQINQLMVNATNMSYEENLDLNIGEEMASGSTAGPSLTQPVPHYTTEFENKYKKPQKPTYNTHVINDSNIITSTVHINDKKPLIVEQVPERSTSAPISLTTSNLNRSSSEIIDLSPPPPTMDYSFKPSTNDEMIMGMSPPPPKPQPPIRNLPRVPSTPRPIPIRTPPPYRNKPPKTLPPRIPPTQRPIRRPINRDEVSTYRPSYDIYNNIHRPIFNRDQPSSQLLPPPREIPSRITPINELPAPTISVPSIPNVVFPTPISSGWLTSSGGDFSSSFDFAPTSVHFPEVPQPSRIPELPDSSTDTYSYEVSSSSERIDEVSSEKPLTEDPLSTSKEGSTESTIRLTSSEEQNVSDAIANESSHEDTTEKVKVVPIGYKNRTRKPYPIRQEDKKPNTSKFKLPTKPTSIIRPTRTLSRPEILYPTRHTSTRKIVRPIPTRSPVVVPSVIESSESSIDDEFIKPTEVLKQNIEATTVLPEGTSLFGKESGIITPSIQEMESSVQPTHHAGNEIKISDEVVPTKTEFRTTVVTLTKTLSEPPRTVSSIGYVNLTHTLTVTHTKTSLVSKSEGAVTQTLILTNTHTSTLVDVVTEVHTQVLPTTIIETVTKHIPIPQVEPTPVQDISLKTKVPLDDLTMSSEENDNLIIKDNETTENIQKIETESEGDNDTFFVVMNKSQNGGKAPPISTDIDTGDYDITRNEQVNSNGVSQVLFGEILLAGTPYLETTNVNPSGVGYGKECQPDCKASRNERCQRIDGMMKCVCRPGFARMFPDRPCKPTYTYSVKLALGSQGNKRLEYHENLSDNSTIEYHALAVATHEGINRMVMQSDLRDVFHGVHITGFQPVEMIGGNGDKFQGVINDFYVQLSDNAHESRLKEVIEKYLRNNNYSLGGTDVHAAGELVEKLDVSDFDECTSGQFHDCSEHAQCFNLRGTYTCSCLEGYADLSVNNLYPGRICSAEPVGCERCNYHGACYSRDDRRVLCECFQWYAGSSCHINLKVVLISLVVLGALLTVVLTVCACIACRRPRPPPRSIVTCIQGMPSLHQGAMPSKQRADRRALISDRTDSGDASSVQNASLPYMPTKRPSNGGKKCVMSDPPSHDPPPPPAPAVMIPRARLHPHHSDSRENISRKKSLELSSEAKLISYLESGAVSNNDEMRRKHSMESSYSANKDRHNKQGALVSAGFKVSTTIRPDEGPMKDDRDDLSSVNKHDLEAELHFDSLRKSYSQEDLSEWTDAERRIGELTLSEARSVGGTLPASTGRAASSTRLTHQEANTMAERDLGSTFLLPHVHLYKPDLTSDVSEFDSL